MKVPLGTAVWEREGNDWYWLGELSEDGGELPLARGGYGGKGNIHFATPNNKVPRLAEEGQAGEQKDIFLELRLFADVGLIGMPNSGKSLITRSVSNAKPVVAEYPFTTQEPVLGNVAIEWAVFTVMELPGLVQGAHVGKGLGAAFLRHLRRARLVAYVVDGSEENPAACLDDLRTEVSLYEPTFASKEQIVIVNKCDLPEAKKRRAGLRRQITNRGLSAHFVSAMTGEGIDQLIKDIHGRLEGIPPQAGGGGPIVRPKASVPRSQHPMVTREGEVFVVSSPRIERLVRLPNLRQFQVRLQLRAELSRLGIVQALEEAGVQTGDRVRIGSVEMQWE